VNFKRKLSIEVKKQEKLDMAEELYSRKKELLWKYIAKTIYY